MTSFREYQQARAEGVVPNHTVADLPTDAIRFQGDRAGFVSRAVAAFLDFLLIFGIVLGTIAVIWMLSFVVAPINPADISGSDAVQSVADRPRRVPAVGLMIVYGYVLNVLYWTAFWALSGRTVGNLIMGLRVVNRKGEHPGWLLALVRAMFCTLFPVGLIWVVASKSNRSVQDTVLRTNVIYDWVVGIPWLARSDADIHRDMSDAFRGTRNAENPSDTSDSGQP
jgi:uncharacterized RDD family membrane protein YckC